MDLVFFLILAVLILAAAPRLRVYFTVYAMRVDVTDVHPDGTRVPVDTPLPLQRVGTPGGPLEEKLVWIETKIRRYCEEQPQARAYEWAIHYAVDSPRMDQSRTVRCEP